MVKWFVLRGFTKESWLAEKAISNCKKLFSITSAARMLEKVEAMSNRSAIYEARTT